MTVRFYKEMKRHYYVTPSSYLDLLKQFQSTLAKKSDQINYVRNRISNGLKASTLDY
jgi:dynein heavy chain